MDVPTPSPQQRVVGVTVPVPEPWASRVRLVRAEADDPLARSIGPHITILPPTLVEREQLERVDRHLDAIAARTTPFVVELDGVDDFRPVSPVVYLNVARGCEDLDALQRNVALVKELGLIGADTDVKKYSDLSILEDATKRLK